MNIQIKIAIIAIVVVIPLTSIAVYGTNSEQYTYIENSKLQVISSFNPLHEFSQIVGRQRVDVISLIPVGVEPHDWEPTIKDVQQMQRADLIVINGIGFENWVDNLVSAGYRGVIIDTSHGIIPMKSQEDDSEHSHESGDPHIWLNPIYAKIQVENIATAFSDADPQNSEFYQTNAAKYGKELDSLDFKIRNELSGCNTVFIAFHDSFSYFAHKYGLTQYTVVPTNDSHGEVTAKTLENVISTARELGIRVIFSEEAVNTKTTQIIANEIGGKVLVLSPLEIVSQGSYISKMTQNLENLKEAMC